MIDSLWGFPLTVSVSVDQRSVDLRDALIVDFAGPIPRVRLDTDKALDLIYNSEREHIHEWTDHVWVARCATCGTLAV